MESVPAGQLMHDETPCVRLVKVFRAHGRQPVADDMFANLPEAHALHVKDPLDEEKVPGMHGSHDVAAEAPYFPAGQARHACWKDVAEDRFLPVNPAGH